MAKKIILDCDPGHDDAVAILLALGNPEIEIVGITTVGGNQSLEKVTYNAACCSKQRMLMIFPYTQDPIVRSCANRKWQNRSMVKQGWMASNCPCLLVRSKTCMP